jgi:hypothetical protein
MSVDTNVRLYFDFDLNSYKCFCGFRCGNVTLFPPYLSYEYAPPGERPLLLAGGRCSMVCTLQIASQGAL